MEKEKTSLAFEKKLWREFKSKCVLDGKSYTEVLEQLMREWTKK